MTDWDKAPVWAKYKARNLTVGVDGLYWLNSESYEPFSTGQKTLFDEDHAYQFSDFLIVDRKLKL